MNKMYNRFNKSWINVLLNPAGSFKDIVDDAKSVVLAGDKTGDVIYLACAGPSLFLFNKFL